MRQLQTKRPGPCSGDIVVHMPIVSMSLSDQAYNIWRGWKDHRNGSKMTSSAIIQYDVRREHVPMLEIGDRRALADGTKLVWTDNGWGLE